MPGFRDIIGRERIKHTLQQAVKGNGRSHAYLFTGDAGLGKEYVARVFAQTLLCTDRKTLSDGTQEPCGVCSACQRVLQDIHPDCRVVTHEKESTLSVKEIRAQVVEDAPIYPYEADLKIYIIPDAELMNAAAQNALLKTLEEPPSYAVILLLAPDPTTLLETIKSRCVTLPLPVLGDGELERFLMETHRVTDYRARAVLRFAQGNIGKAVALALDPVFEERHQNDVRFLRSLPRTGADEIAAFLKERLSGDNKKEARDELMETTRFFLRDLMVARATESRAHLILADEWDYIRDTASKVSYAAMLRMENALRTTQDRIAVNVNAEFALTVFYIQVRDELCCMS